MSGASAQAIRNHYDTSNEFYRLWLDPSMVYSCALWEEGDTLEKAQRRKIDFHIEQARAAGQPRVLDIGCGWGALLRRLVEGHGVRHAVGLTLSLAQAEWIEKRPNIEVRVESWADYRPEEPFDAIISIGAFEHFARLEDSEAEKTAAYRRFFEACHRFLRPGRWMSLQTFAYGSARPREVAARSGATQFLATEIFQETDPPRLANIAEALEGTFEMVALRNDREHYAHTCKEWLDALKRNRQQAIAVVGSERVERYERYLQYSRLGFVCGNLDLYRITLRRLK